MKRREIFAQGAALLAGAAGMTTMAEASVVEAFSKQTMPVDSMNRVAGWSVGAVKPIRVKGRQIGAGRPKIIGPTTSKTPEDFYKTISSFVKMDALDMIECRIDYMGKLQPEEFAAITKKGYELASDKIVLVTLRNGGDGGPYKAEDEYYGSVYEAIIAHGKADFIDLEMFRDAAMIRKLVKAAHAKGIGVVMSDHEFHFTPSTDEMVRRLLLQQEMGADILKLAVMAFSPEDALSVMSATAKVRHYYSDKPMLTMAMGKWGVLTRITGEGFGSDLTFASVGGKASAPGQIPAEDCRAVLQVLHMAMNPQ